MFLYTNGLSRDRTTDFTRYRMGDVPYSSPYRPDKDTAFLLSKNNNVKEKNSELEYFFDLSRKIKNHMNQLDMQFDELLRLQQQCLRPTFDDPSDQRERVSRMNNQISAQLKEIFQSINRISFRSKQNQDKLKIVNNLHMALLERYKEFSTKFSTAQQTFQATYSRSQYFQPETNKDTINFDEFDLGDNTQRAQELQQRRNQQEFEELAQRAAQVLSTFQELANLISVQGTLIDRIDYNVESTLHNAEAAHEDIVKAASYQKKSRMWICAVILIVLIILLVLIAMLR